MRDKNTTYKTYQDIYGTGFMHDLESFGKLFLNEMIELNKIDRFNLEREIRDEFDKEINKYSLEEFNRLCNRIYSKLGEISFPNLVCDEEKIKIKKESVVKAIKSFLQKHRKLSLEDIEEKEKRDKEEEEEDRCTSECGSQCGSDSEEEAEDLFECENCGHINFIYTTEEEEEEDEEEDEEEEEEEEDEEDEEDEEEEEEETEVEIDTITSRNPVSGMRYDDQRNEYHFYHNHPGVIGVRKGICFKCSAFKSVIINNLGNDNSSQICRNCIEGLFDDARNN